VLFTSNLPLTCAMDDLARSMRPNTRKMAGGPTQAAARPTRASLSTFAR
jgi:hypothetical protein